MDIFLSYIQIQMAPKDEENIANVTYKDIYCYKEMPYDLKNARATYQWLVNKVIKD